MPANDKQNQNAATAYNSLQPGPIQLFFDKLKEWRFSLPSINLWTVEIQLHNNGSETNHSLLELYKNIDKANRTYNEVIGTNWKITNSSTGNFANDFLNRLQTDKTAFFLAQALNFDARNVNISENVGDTIGGHSGFIKYGSVESGVNYGPTARIQFIQTNWDLSDILFDRWIAAIAQQGLIEDSSLPNIKADIYLYEYAAGLPNTLKNNRSSNNKEWQLRKITKLIKAFPKGRGQIEKNYDSPGPKIDTIDFSFMDYQIEYVV